ncbi:carbohydrate kinase [Streptomyces sp. H10-C2]|uniref:carbohydrate kinase family protein n=1 Tax=unclassified Streptomyces TaxID=2593676 RepID=UPI0024BA6485|nr:MULTISPECIES: carbohydrate kinase [unclassified Streptomyces]MDJ0345772.1 carbohydrate kinase [Streptomyces sp. PH10-H1]MDJ0374662.1 carbohydrate kinase [Streptomyces sp. H10-C2]
MPPPPPIPLSPTAEMPTLVIGEALTDIITGPDGSRRCCPGGSPANVALGLARLGHPVRLATRMGRDPFGQVLQTHLGRSGVVLTEGSVSDVPTSTATARLDAVGAADYTFDITWQLPARAIESARTGATGHLHTGSIATALAPGADQVLAAIESARDAATVSYDPNLRPVLLGKPGDERPRVEHLVSVSDVVKASQEDMAWLYPGQDIHEVALRWSRSGPSLVVLTFGADGSEVWWRQGRHAMPAPSIEVIDTVGAGDAFMSGLISGLLRAGLLGAGRIAGEPGESPPRTRLHSAASSTHLHQDVLRALRLATRAAALTCTGEGADPPTRADMKERWGPRPRPAP